MRARPLVANAALAVASLGAAALMLEVALRFLYPPPLHFKFPQEFYEFDPEIAHVLRPNQQAYTHDRPVSVNAQGLRDGEYARRPEPGVRRVLALGDSQTFGNGLALEQTWPKQLERLLNARSGSAERWELVNAGIPGTDTWQHEIFLRRLLDVYHPHAVVLAFYVNDVAPKWTPRPRPEGDKTNGWKKRLAYLAKRSSLATLLHQRLRALQHDRELQTGRAFSQYILTGEPDERVERGWEQVEESLRAMQAACAARGLPFLVAVLPRRDQVCGAEPGRAYNQRLAAIAARGGIALVDLLPALTEAYAEHGQALFIPWDGHNSAVANAIIAQQLSEPLAGLTRRMAAR